MVQANRYFQKEHPNAPITYSYSKEAHPNLYIVVFFFRGERKKIRGNFETYEVASFEYAEVTYLKENKQTNKQSKSDEK